MKNSYINNSGLSGSKYFYLHLSRALSYQCKKHLLYATFTFRYDSKDKAVNDFNDILNELKDKGVDTSRHLLV